MSYILDALKRADAERERGHVPGLHSQSTTAPTSAPADPRRQTPGVALVGGAATLLLLIAAIWWWLAAPQPDMPPPATAVAPAAAPLPAAAPAPEPMPAAPPAARVAPALPILSPEPLPAAAPASVRLPTPTQAGTATPTAANPEPAAPANAVHNGNVRSFAELAPEIRAQLPQVSISGSTYSSNPAHRMLIANGKVVHEGEEIAPGLRLETIAPGKAVLNHRGTRYSIGY